MFLQVIEDIITQKEKDLNVSFIAFAHLSEWVLKFNAGKNVNRFFRQISKDAACSTFGERKSRSNRKNLFRHILFSEKMTKCVLSRAEEKAGYMLVMPYLLSVSAIVMHEVLQKRGHVEGDLIIPVTVDCRAENDSNKHLFFNHLSFMFYHVKRALVTGHSALIHSIKEQMYRQVKDDIPASIKNASYLMRIVPVNLFGQLLKLPFAGGKSSFSFATILKSSYSSTVFCGVPIVNILHFPCVPFSPGVGIYFTKHKDTLNMSLSYVEGVLTEDEADAIVRRIRTIIL